MNTEYFTADNCELTASQRAWVNARVAEILDGSTDPDDVKNACDRANDELPEGIA